MTVHKANLHNTKIGIRSAGREHISDPKNRKNFSFQIDSLAIDAPCRIIETFEKYSRNKYFSIDNAEFFSSQSSKTFKNSIGFIILILSLHVSRQEIITFCFNRAGYMRGNHKAESTVRLPAVSSILQ